MEHMTLSLGNDGAFDELVHKGLGAKGSLPQGSDMTLATTDNGTQEGRAIAVIAFDVQLPDGSVRTAQATVTVRQLTMALAALRGRYGDEGRVQVARSGKVRH